MRRSDSPSSISPHFVSFAWRYHLRASSFAPRAEWLVRTRPGLWSTGFPHRFFFRWRRWGLPGSWETLVHARPALGPRRDSGARPLRRPRAAFRNDVVRRLPQLFPIEARSRGSHARCLRFAARVALRSLPSCAGREDRSCHARLASGWWPAFAGRGWLPAGFRWRLSRHVMTFPPPQASPGANITRK
jgi:hypothetical protein